MLKFDDQFPLHRKVDALSDSAFRFHVEAIFWCARHLTDGVVSNDDLDTVSRKVRGGKWTPELVRRECWHRFENGRILADCGECIDRYGPTLSGDGWVVHGWLDWQQTRTKVLQTRAARKAAGKLGGQRSASVRASRASGNKPPGRHGKGSKTQANDETKPAPVAQPHSPPPSSKGGGERARADAGRSALPDDPVPHRPSSNGRPPVAAPPPTELLAATRATLAATRRKQRAGDNRRADPLGELRAATPEIPAPADAPPAEEVSDAAPAT